jgi:hypothetical protein
MNNNAANPISIPALTLTQPWASLVACGAKRIESRSWTTGRRGWLAIHASKAFPLDAQRFAETPVVRKALLAAGYIRQPGDESTCSSWQLPSGQVIAIARLTCIVRLPSEELRVDEQERAFGNYTNGRYAWIFAEVHSLPLQMPARGSLGLWQWKVPVVLRPWLAEYIDMK